MAGAQVRRFLILHKELDADDGEVTRTQKVRRGFVAERYAPLIEALYDGSREADISTEVTFEDGRKGVLSARVKIRDMAAAPPRRRGEGRMRAPPTATRGRRDAALDRERVARVRRRAGDHATCRSTSGRARSAPSSARTAPARPRCSTSSTASISRSRAASPSRARRARKMQPARRGARRHRAHVPERRAVQGHDARSTTSWPAAR